MITKMSGAIITINACTLDAAFTEPCDFRNPLERFGRFPMNSTAQNIVSDRKNLMAIGDRKKLMIIGKKTPHGLIVFLCFSMQNGTRKMERFWEWVSV